ncbi:MAG TPA: hypothetical protein VKB78_15170 [Pirellulales bacterium]|nr:hypothetical protein [Pirellulales bacterium]
MSNDSKVTLVLIVGGMIFILASIGAVAYLYHEHANSFIIPHEGLGLDNFGMFLVGAGLPAAVGVIVGVVLLAIGFKQHNCGPRENRPA